MHRTRLSGRTMVPVECDSAFNSSWHVLSTVSIMLERALKFRYLFGSAWLRRPAQPA